MHRLIQDHLEEMLGSRALPADHAASVHLRDCMECRDIVATMRAQNELLREWAMPEAEVEPQPGFYARVLEQIALQRPVSIWALFTDSLMGRRLAMASLAAALTLGVFMVASEPAVESIVAQHQLQGEQLDPLYPAAGFATDLVAANTSTSSGEVFMSLVSYREH